MDNGHKIVITPGPPPGFHEAGNGAVLWSPGDSGNSGSEPPSVTGGVVYAICGYNDVCLYTPQ